MTEVPDAILMQEDAESAAPASESETLVLAGPRAVLSHTKLSPSIGASYSSHLGGLFAEEMRLAASMPEHLRIASAEVASIETSQQ